VHSTPLESHTLQYASTEIDHSLRSNPATFAPVTILRHERHFHICNGVFGASCTNISDNPNVCTLLSRGLFYCLHGMFGDPRREISNDFTFSLLLWVRRGCCTDYTTCILWLTTGISFLLFIFHLLRAFWSLYLRREWWSRSKRDASFFARAACRLRCTRWGSAEQRQQKRHG
jgi:hypothetical protein